MQTSNNLRRTLIAYLLFSFCAIQISTIHFHHSQTGDNESSHSHQLEVHIYQANTDNLTHEIHLNHTEGAEIIEFDYESTLLHVLKHISNLNNFRFWYTAINETHSVAKRLLSNVVIYNKHNYIPYLRSQAPPTFM